MSRLRENAGLRLVSLGLAIVLWFVAQGEQTYQATVVAPVKYVMPEDLVLINDAAPPEQVVIRASGSRASLRSLQEQLRDSPARFVVNVEDAAPGRTVHSFRKLPAGVGQDVTIVTISPAEVELTFDEVGRRTLPVLLRTRGKLPSGFVEAARSLQPPEVTLSGAASELADLEFIQTLPIRLESRRTSFEGELGLDVGDLHLTEDSARLVVARLEVAEAMADREYGVVPVTIALEGVTVEPEACLVRVRGPVPVLDALEAGVVRGELRGDRDALDLTEGSTSVGWTRDAVVEAPAVAIRIDHPRAADVEVLSVSPERFVVTAIAPPEPDPPAPTPAEDDGG